MPKQESPLQALEEFLPPGSYSMVEQYLHQHKVHLTITRARSSILGDYRHAVHGKNHRISVNGNLNTHAFLITLLHELAHLLTFQYHGNRVQAHGKEWKKQFGDILKTFIQADIFPPVIRESLIRSLHNPAASSCADDELMRILRQFDEPREGVCLVEDLHKGNLFQIKGGRVFRKEEVLRKRIKCTEVQTGKTYLFSPVYEVRILIKKDS
jgi:SprT protein